MSGSRALQLTLSSKNVMAGLQRLLWGGNLLWSWDIPRYWARKAVRDQVLWCFGLVLVGVEFCLHYVYYKYTIVLIDFSFNYIRQDSINYVMI